MGRREWRMGRRLSVWGGGIGDWGGGYRGQGGEGEAWKMVEGIMAGRGAVARAGLFTEAVVIMLRGVWTWGRGGERKGR